ncbi:hypothetical protein [Halobacteriovorax sp. RZ-2]|uniref:hypothetical protein n=1 Tax=unclassified Halobacteriovorax TaxID=2639665 RepID=UPI00371E9221
MDNTVIIIALLVIIAIALFLLIGVFAFIAFRKEIQKEETQDGKLTDKINNLLEKNKSQEKILGLCSICEKELVENDYFNVDSLHLCRDHFNLYSRHEWVAITNERTTSDTPEKGVYIYNFKKNTWDNDKIPTFILCEYKIDVESDLIETYVQLHVQKEIEDEMRQRLKIQK